jgi:hypothetical protein
MVLTSSEKGMTTLSRLVGWQAASVGISNRRYNQVFFIIVFTLFLL